MPSPSCESETSRDSGSKSELIMDSKSKTCRNANLKSGFMDSPSPCSS
jgi:hypothetical protein